jgi:hypothetical protein
MEPSNRPYRKGVATAIAGANRILGGQDGPSAFAPFRNIGGPATRTAVLSALGAGGGWLYGKYIHPIIGDPDADSRDTARTGAILGALAPILMSAPGLALNARRHGLRHINSTPYSRTKGGSFWREPNIYAPSARVDLLDDKWLTPRQRASLLKAFPASRKGFISTPDIARGLVGAGIGYAAAGAASTMLGGIFGMAPTTRKKLQAAGAVAGALRNTGIWR